jgi:predicted secreted hydrolase
MRALLATVLGVFLAACAPAPALDPFVERAPDPIADLPAHRAPVEWWYFSGHLNTADGRPIAFASTIFQVFLPPGTTVGPLDVGAIYRDPFYFGHTVLVDERHGGFRFSERSSLPRRSGRPSPHRGSASTERLDARLGDWSIVREPVGRYLLSASVEDGRRIDLQMTPAKPEVAHGPGWSGTAASGRMYYTSATRLLARGTVGGEAVSGTVWFDHQWGGGDGDGSASAVPRWDWLGLHLDDGRDLMVYRIRDATGRVTDQFASIVDKDGRETSTRDITFEGGDQRAAPSGTMYPTTWRVRLPDGTDITVRLPSAAYELSTTLPAITYLEGPVTVSGTVTGRGFAELTGYAPAASSPREYLGR